MYIPVKVKPAAKVKAATKKPPKDKKKVVTSTPVLDDNINNEED